MTEQIVIEGKRFNQPEHDCQKDKNDGPCIGEGCRKSHFQEVCNVCGISYGQHSGHKCPVGNTTGHFSGRLSFLFFLSFFFDSFSRILFFELQMQISNQRNEVKRIPKNAKVKGKTFCLFEETQQNFQEKQFIHKTLLFQFFFKKGRTKRQYRKPSSLMWHKDWQTLQRQWCDLKKMFRNKKRRKEVNKEKSI